MAGTSTSSATFVPKTNPEHDEPEIESPPPEEEKKLEGYWSTDSDDEFFNDGYHAMKYEEWQRYSKELRESDGFDVSSYPKVIMEGMIVPGYLEVPNYMKNYEFFAKFAIEKEKANIKFEKVVKVMEQVDCPINYYLTFEAKDLDDGGRTKTYQALVYRHLPAETSEVALFRLKPGQ